MSAAHNIEAVAVIVVVDGRHTLAPIDPAAALLFVQMIAAFQAGAPKATKLVTLPAPVVKKVEAMGEALGQAMAAARARSAAA